MIQTVLYVLASLIIGLLGINRRFGFWGYFFGALTLTPFVGLVLLFGSDRRKSQPSQPEES